LTDTDLAATRRRPLLVTAAQIGPALIFFGLFFLVPAAILLLYSFYRGGFFELDRSLTGDNYVEAFTDSTYRRVILNTLYLSTLVAIVVVLLAYPFSYVMSFVFTRQRELILFLVLISLFSGYLVRIYAWRTILGSEGIINSTLVSTGLRDEPLRFLLYSKFAVVLTLVNLILPFAILPLYAAMQNVSKDAIEAARDLGGGRWTSFQTIVLPLTIRGALVAFAFAFVLTAGDYVTPTLVGGQGGVLVGNVIADQFGAAGNLPLGAALGVVSIVLALLCVLVVSRTLIKAVR
jgi:spermidine/putrescine transport system permease protein